MHICHGNMPALDIPRNDVGSMQDKAGYGQINNCPGSALLLLKYLDQAGNSGKEVKGKGQFKK